jgi:hypothetical protein
MKIPTFLGIAGLIAIYIFLSRAGHLPNDKTEADLRIEKQRKVLLAKVESDQTKQATTYGWVNKEKGVVRIPIDRAMELAVKELQAK